VKKNLFNIDLDKSSDVYGSNLWKLVIHVQQSVKKSIEK